MALSTPRTTGSALDESSPLLQRQHSANPALLRKHPHRISISVLLGALIVVIDLASFIALPAQTQILEDNICQRYYAGIERSFPVKGTVDCKVNPVQSELAFISGWKDTVNVIPTLFLALPYGVAADRWGRRPVLLLSMGGVVLSETFFRVVCWWSEIFAPRLVLWSPVLTLIGGGDQIASTMVFVIAADIWNQSERANAFFALIAAVLVSEFIGAPIGAALTSIDPWAGFLVSFAVLLVGFLGVFLVPETLVKRSDTSESDDEYEDSQSGDEGLKRRSFQDRLVAWRTQIYNYTHFIWKDGNIPLLMVMFFVGALGRQSTVFLIIYASKKFHWTIGKASFLVTARAASKMTLVLAILPLLTILLQRRFRFGAARKDLFLSKGQSLLMVAGMFTIAYAPVPWMLVGGVVLFALGSAFDLTVRSLITSLVHQDHFATLYTMITLVQSTGILVSGPTLAAALSKGFELGGRWMSLPFTIAGALYVLTLLAIFSVKLPKTQPDEEEEQQQQQQRSV